MTIYSSFAAKSAFLARGSVLVFGGGRSLAVAALVSWLVTESLGAYMLGSWIRSGGRHRGSRNPQATPPSLVFGHALLAATGFVGWLSFVTTHWAVFAWASIGLLALAIGLGISTVTIWTPYPVREAEQAPAPAVSASAENQELSAGLTDEMLARALSDEVLASKIVDDLLARMLADPGPPARRRRADLAPLIPAAHGLMAIATFLLAMLAGTAAL